MRVRKINRVALQAMQEDFYKTWTAPLDDMWALGIVARGNFYEILMENRIGYLVVNEDHELLEFYIKEAFASEALEILLSCIHLLNIKKAYAITYAPSYFKLCMDLSDHHEVNSLLYEHEEKIAIKLPVVQLIHVIATYEMLDEAMAYTVNTIAASVEWLKPYYEGLIKTESLILYKLNDKIVATGEVRPSQISLGYANIGMTVAFDYRLKGLGSYVLNDMVKRSYDKNLKPICGTDIENIASQKTIEKCGFKVYHKVLKFKFKK